ncbi:MAG TPA: SDR family oxidoreductase [Sandaracinaceae bacterium LLY-WYZ-13_1]|nr:SDR family oxidoreductase [Sandaracinaceae bacterium LLY-WYZ-13_1]
MELSKTNALITGASRGLGRALAEALAERGARVVLVAREAAPLEAAAEAIRAAGGDAHALPADVAAADAGARIAGTAHAMVGSLDLVVHNASTLGPVPLRPLSETSDAELERALAVNLVGAFRITRAVVGQMVTRGRGTLVHVSSDAAVEPHPTWGAYAVSKAALDHLAAVWAAELRGTGVRSFAVDPGEMDTAMHAAAIPDADPAALERPAAVAARIARLIEDPSLAPSGARVEAARVPAAEAVAGGRA